MPLNLQDNYAYYELKRLAIRWGISQGEIIALGADGDIELSIYGESLPLACGQIVRLANGYSQKTGTIVIHDGVLPLRMEDVERLMLKGSVEVRRFRPSSGDDYRELDSDQASRMVGVSDIIVAYDTATTFERNHKLKVRDVIIKNFTINPQIVFDLVVEGNYKVVSLGPRHWNLGALQGTVIRRLHEASLMDQPWQFGKQLLAGSGAGTLRLKDLFKSQKNWRELIMSDGRGMYRLNCAPRLWLPDAESA